MAAPHVHVDGGAEGDRVWIKLAAVLVLLEEGLERVEEGQRRLYVAEAQELARRAVSCALPWLKGFAAPVFFLTCSSGTHSSGSKHPNIGHSSVRWDRHVAQLRWRRSQFDKCCRPSTRDPAPRCSGPKRSRRSKCIGVRQGLVKVVASSTALPWSAVLL